MQSLELISEKLQLESFTPYKSLFSLVYNQKLRKFTNLFQKETVSFFFGDSYFDGGPHGTNVTEYMLGPFYHKGFNGSGETLVTNFSERLGYEMVRVNSTTLGGELFEQTLPPFKSFESFEGKIFNFGTGGAGIGSQNSINFLNPNLPINLGGVSEQIDTFKEVIDLIDIEGEGSKHKNKQKAKAKKQKAKDLTSSLTDIEPLDTVATVLAGGNDLLIELQSFIFEGQLPEFNYLQLVAEQMVADKKSAVDELLNHNIDQVFLFDLAIDKIPYVEIVNKELPGLRKLATTFTNYYNNALDELFSHPDYGDRVDIISLRDIFTLLYDHGNFFGLPIYGPATNAYSAGMGIAEFEEFAPPELSTFYDEIHPTGVAWNIIGEIATAEMYYAQAIEKLPFMGTGIPSPLAALEAIAYN